MTGHGDVRHSGGMGLRSQERVVDILYNRMGIVDDLGVCSQLHTVAEFGVAARFCTLVPSHPFDIVVNSVDMAHQSAFRLGLINTLGPWTTVPCHTFFVDVSHVRLQNSALAGPV